MTTESKGITVVIMANGEIRMVAALYPEEAERGALVRGLTAAEAEQLGRELLEAARLGGVAG